MKSNKRYQIEKTLGEGGMGRVYLAYDREAGRRVALKFLLGSQDTSGLAEEFRLLARLSHPQLVGIYDFHLHRAELCDSELEDGPCFSMEYVAGHALDRCAVFKNWTAEQWMIALGESAAALHYLHSRNIFHRDLKPSNLIYGEDGHIHLLDFGLSREAGKELRQGPEGTLDYLAPEAFWGDYEARSDLFSLGVVFYELLSGQRPYPHWPPVGDANVVAPKHLKELKPGLPDFFCDLLQRLIELSPGHRPSSALALIQYLRRHEVALPKIQGEEAAENLLQRLPWQRPETVYQKCWEVLREASSNRGPSVLTLLGPTGSGRSRFLEETRWQYQLAGGEWVALQPEVAGHWIEEAETRVLKQSSQKSVSPLERFGKIFCPSRGKPWVVVFEDLQLWPENNLKEVFLLLKWWEQNRPSCRIFLEWNTDWENSVFQAISNFLEGSAHALSLSLPDLTSQESEALLRSAPLEKAPPDPWIANMIQASGGRPLLLVEGLSQGMIRGFKESDIEAVSVSERLQQSCRQKLQRLSTTATQLFTLGLCRGEAFPSVELLALSVGDRSTWEDALWECERQGLLRRGPQGFQEIQLAQASLRRIWLEVVDPALRKKCHALWLEGLLKQSGADAKNTARSAMIAEQAYGAEDPRYLMEWGMAAAHYFQTREDPERAIAWYQRLLPWAKDGTERYFIQANLAPLFINRGQFKEAKSAYEKWFEDRPDDETQLQKTKFFFYTGLTDFAAGNYDEAWTRLESCLQIGPMGRYPSHHSYHARALSFLSVMAKKQGKVEAARNFLAQAGELAGEDPVLRGEIEQRQGELEQEHLQFAKALEHFRECLAQAKRSDNPQAQAVAFHLLALWAQEYGRPQEALALIDQSLHFSETGGVLLQWARYLANLALLQMDLGRYGEAWAGIQTARPVIEVYGNQDDREVFQLHQMEFHSRTGNQETAELLRSELEKTSSEGQSRGWWPEFCLRVAEMAWLDRDWSSAETWFIRGLRESGPHGSPHQLFRLSLGLCRLQIFQDSLQRDSAPFRIVSRCLPELEGPLFKVWRQLLLFWESPETVSPNFLGELIKALEGIESAESRMQLQSLLALMLARRGYRDSAQFLWDLFLQTWNKIAIPLPEELKMDFEKNRQPGSLDQELQQILTDSLGARPKPASPVPATVISPTAAAATNLPPAAGALFSVSEQRFRQYIEISRQIAQKDNLGEILERVMDAAIEFTGAERGFLILESPGAKGGPIPGFEVKTARHFNQKALSGIDVQISMTAVRQAMDKGSYLLTANAQLDERLKQQKSVVQYQLTSILVVPFELEGQVLGALYLDHRYAPDCFRQEDIIFLNAFAAQTVLAIQKARLISDLRVANTQLTEKVESQAKYIEVLNGELAQVRDQLRYGYEEIIGQSPAIMAVLQILDHVTDTLIPAWIFGESGTGKELVARSLHFNSSRKQGPFVTVNCSAIPETLLESELFGHKKGSFTHADRDRAGLFEQANGGTIFLDEVADMTMSMQVKLLRVLQEGEVRPVGASKSIKIDVRVVTASNKDLQQLVDEEKFRQDLFFRINGITIKLPPLRERKEDIPLLVNHLIHKLAQNFKLEPCAVSDEAYEKLVNFPWPGNIRQLESILRNAMLFAQGRSIVPAYINLPTESVDKAAASHAASGKAHEKSEERRLILEALRRHQLSKPDAAKDLGITLRGLYLKMDRFGIPKGKTVLAKFLGMKVVL